METFKSFEDQLYRVNETTFPEIALRLFRFQAEFNPVYHQFLRHLGVGANDVSDWHQIPFLPITFFKSHEVKTGNWSEEIVYTSSGTEGIPSRHFVPDRNFYLKNAALCFSCFYGDPADWTFLALLPSYLERKGSSLIDMVDEFIKADKTQQSGFFLYEHEALLARIEKLRGAGRKVMLWGVSFALLDLAEKFDVDLSHCTLIETGGMKGRRQEITREEFHHILMRKLKVSEVHSEFGMTELLSQAYSVGKGVFQTPPWMKVLIRDPDDPLTWSGKMGTGGLNVIDLANIRSCAFVETQDMAKIGENGSFEVLGRLDNSDVRGCNLLVE